jgi:acetolactate decarboxylase
MNKTFLSFLVLLLTAKTFAQNVKNIGSMSEMGKENFAPHIKLDTIANKKHLFGMGPYGRMQGEISVFDGVPYFSTVNHVGEGIVDNNWAIEAPFFVYAHVVKWIKKKKQIVAGNLDELQSEIEIYAQQNGQNLKEPFVVKLKGKMDNITTHIVMPRSENIPGYQANKKQMDYDFTNIQGEILVFYSQNHQGIYTHKDSFIHVHFISKDKKTMGHIDKIKIAKTIEISISKF